MKKRDHTDKKLFASAPEAVRRLQEQAKREQRLIERRRWKAAQRANQ